MRHRIRQGLRALFAFATPLDETPALEVLSPELFALFQRMRRSERLHALNVMATLQAAGHTDPDLLVAALLHDVGKSRFPLGVPGRTAAVLAKRFAPRWYRRQSEKPPRGLTRPFAIAEQHPAWSAEDMAAAGASDRAVWLGRHHAADPATLTADSEPRTLLEILQWADDAS